MLSVAPPGEVVEPTSPGTVMGPRSPGPESSVDAPPASPPPATPKAPTSPPPSRDDDEDEDGGVVAAPGTVAPPTTGGVAAPGTPPPATMAPPSGGTGPGGSPPTNVAPPTGSGGGGGGAPGGAPTGNVSAPGPSGPPPPPSGGLPSPGGVPVSPPGGTPLPPGGAPPAGVVTPPPAGGSPPSVPGGGASSSLEEGLSKAKELWEQGKEIRDERTADDEDEPEDEVVEEPESLYVDYSDTWDEEPPEPTTTTVVVTRVIDRPVPRPPVPEPADVEPTRVRGFLGFSSRGTSTNANPSALLGARAGFTFHDRFTIGGAFYSLTARYADAITDSRGRELGLRMAYAGVLLGWRVYSGRVVHLGVETLAGGGAACIAKGTKSVGPARCIDKVGMVSLEPGVELGFVVTDWMKLGLTGGFRFVTRESWREPNDFTLSGPYMGLNVDFGRFRDRR